jgi:hypothetical protein
MKMRRMLTLIGAGALWTGGVVSAHHSFTSTYHIDKVVRIEGKIVQFQFRNPHSFVQIMGTDETGKLNRWAVEWAAAGQLGEQGVTRQSLSIGDDVVITGNPGRTAADHRLRMLTLHRSSDGFGWGTSQGETVD